MEKGLEVGDFGVEFDYICLYFLNGLDDEGFHKGLGSNRGSDEVDSSGYFDRLVVLVDGEGVGGFFG